VDEHALAGLEAAMSTSACHAVRPASGSAAAWTWSRLSGLRTDWRDGAATYSAYAPAARGNSGMPNTSSPREPVRRHDLVDHAGDVPARIAGGWTSGYAPERM